MKKLQVIVIAIALLLILAGSAELLEAKGPQQCGTTCTCDGSGDPNHCYLDCVRCVAAWQTCTDEYGPTTCGQWCENNPCR